MRKVVIAGGSGFLGEVLQKHFVNRGDDVYVLSRRAACQKGAVKFLQWNGKDKGPWTSCLEGADVLINLAGRTVNCRYNKKNKQQILDSRVESTELLGRVIEDLKSKPSVWLNASTATIYEASYDHPHDEENGIIGDGFSVGIAKSWEKAFFEKDHEGVRQVAMRTAMVIGEGGAFLDLMTKIVRLRLGGRQGTGKQMVSWLHEADWIGAIEFILSHNEIDGTINLAAPKPICNADMMAELRQACDVKVGLPAYTWMVYLGAFLMGTEAELPLKSRYVIPGRLLKSGYRFKFETMQAALNDLISK